LSFDPNTPASIIERRPWEPRPTDQAIERPGSRQRPLIERPARGGPGSTPGGSRAVPAPFDRASRLHPIAAASALRASPGGRSAHSPASLPQSPPPAPYGSRQAAERRLTGRPQRPTSLARRPDRRLSTTRQRPTGASPGGRSPARYAPDDVIENHELALTIPSNSLSKVFPKYSPKYS
jgi:hypothetical protein